MIDDIVFYTSLLVCISLGSYYKKIEDPEMKRNYGAGLGLLVACMICGHQIYHTVLMVWGNVIIIKCCDKRYVHIMSLAYTWIYLIYLHFNCINTIYVLWIHQTLALRLVGLAFEVVISERSKLVNTLEIKTDKSTPFLKGEVDVTMPSDPTAVDIITYSYFFVGLHKGPYYRWKIFNDHFNAPFGILGDCRIITEQKLKKAFVCTVGYFLLHSKYNPELLQQDDFYTSYQSEARFLYFVPQLIMYFLRAQIVMMLCTSVCTETGFGVYPAKCNPLPGVGPSAGLSLLKLASTTTDVALEQEYNFSMLKCFDNKKLLIGPKMRDTIRSWDMPTRYWFWAYPYKNLFRAQKETKSACSFLVWTVWAGPSLQRLIIAVTTWVYVHLEAEYSELCDASFSMKMTWDIGFGIMRTLYLIYMTPCLVIDNTEKVLKFYNSIFWVYHIVLLTLMVIAFLIHKSKRPPVTLDPGDNAPQMPNGPHSVNTIYSAQASYTPNVLNSQNASHIPNTPLSPSNATRLSTEKQSSNATRLSNEKQSMNTTVPRQLSEKQNFTCLSNASHSLNVSRATNTARPSNDLRPTTAPKT